MQINVSFEDLTELKEFAALIMGDAPKHKTVTKTVKPEATVPSVPAAAAAPVSAEPVAVPVAEPTKAVPTSTVVPVDAVMPTNTAIPVSAAMPVNTAVPTATVSYTLDDLARAGMTLMDSGRQADLQGLLKNFGVDALPKLPKEQYGAFATALRGMGAQI